MSTIKLLTVPMRGIVRFPLFQLFVVAAAIVGLQAALPTPSVSAAPNPARDRGR